MRTNQKGFGAVEGILILVIVGLLGFIGWYVYDTKNNTDKSLNAADGVNNSSPSKTSDSTTNWQTYQGDGFTIKYPVDWKFVAKGTVAGGGEFALDEFLPTANYPDNNADSISFDTATTNDTVSVYASNNGPSEGQVSAKILTINSYPAYKVNFNVPGPSGAPNGYTVYVGHNIGHNGTIVAFNYVAGNDDKYKSTYEKIVDSIKFTD